MGYSSGDSEHGCEPNPFSASQRLAEHALVGIFVLLLLYTFYFAAPVIMPLTLAVLLSLLLIPIVRFLTNLHIPQSLAAGLVVLAILLLLGAIIYLLSAPAAEWLEKAPQSLRTLEMKLHAVRGPIIKVQKTAEKVAEITELGQETEKPLVRVEGEKLSQAVFVTTPKIFAFFLLLIVLLFFLLATGDSVARGLVRFISKMESRACASQVGHDIQQQISRYLLTISIINAGLGLLTALVMHLLDMPNPLLWGAMAALFNYAPYIGALITALILTLVAVVTFDTFIHIAAVPATFLFLTTLEGQVVTPMIVGVRLALNPLLVFLSMVVWGWMWGVAGALLAVPLLATFKIVCQSVESLKPIASFIGGQQV